MKKWALPSGLCLMLAVLSGCAPFKNYPPMATETYVDLERFMGEWYVIANIPTFLEKEAFNAVETYSLNEDGTVATTFTFNKGGFDGQEKKYRPRGFIKNKETNALWGMQFIWPFKADYRIVYVDEGYTQTVIARKQRDYVWIMARSPAVPEEDLTRLIKLISDLGYDTSKIRPVPQRSRMERGL